MLQLLGARGFQSLLQNYRARISGSVNDDDEEDDMILSNFRRRSRKKKNIEDCYPPVPNDNGKELMKSGKYGSQDTHTDIRRKRKDTLAKRLMWRRLGLDVRGSQTRSNRLIAQVRLSFSSEANHLLIDRSLCYHLSTQGPLNTSSTTTTGHTVANLAMTATSSSRALRTSMSACMTLLIPTIGNITKESTIPWVNGL